MASPMVISTGPPTCAQDDGGSQANAPTIEVLCFSYFSHLVSSVFVSSWFTGLSKFSFTKFRFAFCSPPVTVKVLFVPVNSIVGASIASLCSNYVRSAQSKIVVNLRVLPRTR